MNCDTETYVIAEAGVNHNGSINTAKRLIEVAAEAGANAVKFQTFIAEAIVSKSAPKARYQRGTDLSESHLEMIKKLELSRDHHELLCAYAGECGVDFISTPFDDASVEFLTNQLGIKTIKVASGEITNAPLLLRIARSAERIILSTGMSSLSEVEAALGVLAFGLAENVEKEPTAAGFLECYSSVDGQSALSARVALLHCTSEYPAPIDEVHLRAMDTLRAAFGLPVGLSDHTAGIYVSVAATARGARIIEKHFTLDRSMAGPDHSASLEPEDLTRMIAAIREVERCLGTPLKAARPSETKNRAVARKSIVAARDIRKGELFSARNLTFKRPGTGRSPFEFWSLIGNQAVRDYAADELI